MKSATTTTNRQLNWLLHGFLLVAAALFLSISLSGCFDEGSKTASQQSSVSFFGSRDVISVPKYDEKKLVAIMLTGSINERDSDVLSLLSDLQKSGSSFRAALVHGKVVILSEESFGGFDVQVEDSLKRKLVRYDLAVRGANGKGVFFRAEWSAGGKLIVLTGKEAALG